MKGFTHTRSLVVEWGHCDPAGIVFNPRFFEYFDWSTALLLEAALGCDKAEMTRRYGLVGIPLVDTRARFMIPARYGETVAIASTVVDIGRSSFGIRHQLTKGGALAVEGEEVRVWAGHDPSGQRPLKAKPIPDEVAARLRGADGLHVQAESPGRELPTASS